SQAAPRGPIQGAPVSGPGGPLANARMTEPTTFTRGLSIASMAFLDAVMPPIVSVGLLYGLCALYGAEFKDFFVVLAILSALLSLLLPRGQPANGTQLVKSTIPLAMGVVM